MRSRNSDSITLQLAAWLAAEGSGVHSNDVGPLLGHAARLGQSAWIDEALPTGWEEAVAALLSDPWELATAASREAPSRRVSLPEAIVPAVLATRSPGLPRHKPH